MNKNSMFEIVADDLTLLEQELLSVLYSPEKLVTDIGRHLVEAGGKRLRPALYFMCAQHKVKDPAERLPMAAAIELIHMATLVHDDVIDNATTRRNRPTANSCWGNHASVLVGDFLFAKAFVHVANHADRKMMAVLSEVVCTMCEGEVNQNCSIFDAQQQEKDYLARIAQKTANFIAASCELGALAAKLPAEEVAALREYGYALGMAFQITDDILDITATATQVGKPVGNDLRQGIVTMPVIYALQHSPDREELAGIVGNMALTEEEIRRGLQIVHNTDAVEYSYQRVADYLKQARDIIPASVDNKHRQALIAVADFIGMREY